MPGCWNDLVEGETVAELHPQKPFESQSFCDSKGVFSSEFFCSDTVDSTCLASPPQSLPELDISALMIDPKPFSPNQWGKKDNGC
jgi:hypothetical protein